MTTQSVSQANRRLLRRLLLIVVGMFGFGFALVPLYNVFCEITGLNGKTGSKAVAVTEIEGGVDTARTITVEFVANTSASAPWQFVPEVVKMQVHPGEFYHTSYFARNLTNESLLGQAIPSVSPGPAAQYFQKIECFCFVRQPFAPHEDKAMPVAFRLDPAIPPHISTVTLSYTFFRLEAQGG